MNRITRLLANNKLWAAHCLTQDPAHFARLAAVHAPDFLWIGCSDARVPANTLLGLKSGEVFVHRNIANQVSSADLNGLSVIQFAVESLRVKDIIVCGHHGCGGIQAVLGIQKVGAVVNKWLAPLRELSLQHQKEFDAIRDPVLRTNRLSELNVRAQVLNVCETSFVQEAWEAGRDLSIHGLVYDINDGLLRSLALSISGKTNLAAIQAQK